MKRMSPKRIAVLSASMLALSLPAASEAGGAVTQGPVTKTFSFISASQSKTVTLVNTNALLINARCNAQGEPLIFAFSSSHNADLFGRFYDGLGRLHIVRDSSFVKGNPAVRLSATTGDFDGTGTVLFETYNGRVVTVDYAFDNSTTLAKRNVCTVYGSAISS
jgi:hypothetical protein